jgi:hypothetical protein
VPLGSVLKSKPEKHFRPVPAPRFAVDGIRLYDGQPITDHGLLSECCTDCYSLKKLPPFLQWLRTPQVACFQTLASRWSSSPGPENTRTCNVCIVLFVRRRASPVDPIAFTEKFNAISTSFSTIHNSLAVSGVEPSRPLRTRGPRDRPRASGGRQLIVYGFCLLWPE